ncbi:50S ribosomal protein L38e [Candidatus Bathyarchaeota archaeon]|nr:MAG: 50S ribosomal protein L38e [Candidatus Bathyarchaeota archaeon]
MRRRRRMGSMPKEIFDADEFLALAEKASKCLVKKLDGETKLKLRTSRYLYTITLEPSEADTLLGKIQCPKEEL